AARWRAAPSPLGLGPAHDVQARWRSRAMHCQSDRAHEPRRPTVTGQLAQKIRSTEHAALRRQAQEDLTNGLEMDRPTLALLGTRVDVAQATLERVFVEDRGRAGRTVDSGDDVTRLVDRPGGRQAQSHVLLVQKLALSLSRLPHLGESLVDEGTRRPQ